PTPDRPDRGPVAWLRVRMPIHLRHRLRSPLLSALPFCIFLGLPRSLPAVEAAPADPDSPAHGRIEGTAVPTPTGRTRFWQRITAHEPTYVLVELVPPESREVSVKFQLSFAFQLVG